MLVPFRPRVAKLPVSKVFQLEGANSSCVLLLLLLVGVASELAPSNWTICNSPIVHLSFPVVTSERPSWYRVSLSLSPFTVSSDESYLASGKPFVLGNLAIV